MEGATNEIIPTLFRPLVGLAGSNDQKGQRPTGANARAGFGSTFEVGRTWDRDMHSSTGLWCPLKIL